MKQSLSNENIAEVCARMGHLIHAGVGMGQWGALLDGELAAALDTGLPCHAAMEAAGFPRTVTALVRIGEASGKLEEALFALADYYEQRHRTGKLLQNAVSYPAMTLALMLVVVGVLLVKVLPIFNGVYASLGTRLTGIAGGLLQLGYWLKASLPALFCLLAAAVVFGLLFAKWAPFRKAISGFWQKKWGDRGISRKFNNARYLQGLAMALSSGMALEEAMDLAQLLMEDQGSARRCRECARDILAGTDLAEALEGRQFLDKTDCALLQVGIRSGSGEGILQQIAGKKLRQAQEELENAIGRIEPMLVMGASILVGLILLSVMLPLMDILAVLR